MSSHEDELFEDSDSDSDVDLDRQIRAHIREARQGASVPEFDAVMAKAAAEAEAEAVSQSRASTLDWLWALFSGPTATWASAAAAVGVLGVFVLLAIRPASELSEAQVLAYLPASVSVSQQQLVADLNSSTRWQAPSDGWPTAEADLDILGLPDLDRFAVTKEDSTWL